jgi:glycosyltransferase involved in cell wall biosynthesis
MVAASHSLPLISVITACFNGAEFITNAIESVLSQTYPRLEYLIIDGGSTDGTVEIIRRYAPRLAYWHSQPDRGLAHAFNLGLAQAKGEWILFLNADDYLADATVLERMAPHLLKAGEADVVFGQIAFIPRQQTKPENLTDIRGGPWRWSRFRFTCTIPHQAAFTRRRFFQGMGVFEEGKRATMDYEHYLRAGRRLKTVFVPQLVSLMRDGGASQDVQKILEEWRDAQLANRSAPSWMVWGNYLCRLLWNKLTRR